MRLFRTGLGTTLAIGLGLVSGPTVAHAQKLILLVRHAEKVDESEDAALSAAGRARALRLAELLRDAGVTQVYSTPFQRTRDTVKPTAERAKLAVQPYKEAAALVAKLRAGKADEIALVAAHSNTVPELLQLLGHAPAVNIGAAEFDNLFVVVPKAGGPPVVTRLRY